MTSYIYKTKQANPPTVGDVGGKAFSLWQLDHWNVNVPDWFCVTSSACRAFFEHNSIHFDPRTSDLETIKEQILEGELPEDLLHSIYKTANDMGPGLFAIRSSYSKEDGQNYSFAGQFESLLGVETSAMIEAIKVCWASFFKANVLAYMNQQNQSDFTHFMPVVIQRMITPLSSGVCFSRSPFNDFDKDKILIDSVWGLGCGLVNGDLDADSFVVDRRTMTLNSQIVKKEDFFTIGNNGATIRQPAPQELLTKPSLDHKIVLYLAREAIRLEELYQAPVDIEWCYDGEQVHIVQIRAITTLPRLEFFNSEEEYALFDNSNIIESYSGVVLPLTFSFARGAYARVYEQFCEVLGVPQRTILKNRTLFANMLCHFRGRVFYNLLNWYRLVFLFPNAEKSSRFMETMMGVQEGLDSRIKKKFDFSFEGYRPTFFKRIYLAILTIYRFFIINKTIRYFESKVTQKFNEYKNINFNPLGIGKTLALLDTFKTEVMADWKAPLLNDCRCMIMFGIYNSLLERWLDDEKLRGDAKYLIASQGQLCSLAPVVSLQSIARDLRNGAIEGLELFKHNDDEAYRLMTQSPRYLEMHKRFTLHLDAYGFRCPDELKLEVVDYHMRPELLLANLRRVLMHATTEESSSISPEDIQKRIKSSIGRVKYLVFKFFYKQAAAAISDRETLRLHRTTAYGLIRRMYNQIGRQFAKLGIIQEAKDIFYLTESEIAEYIDGRSFFPHFQDVIIYRKKLFHDFEKRPFIRERFVTQSPHALAQGFDGICYPTSTSHSQDNNDQEIKGTPCSPGIVQGKAHIARHYEEAESIQDGILVTERTDPGWVTLYGACKGLIIERGSMLSHSAIVAREMGLPTIVGAKGAVSMLKHNEEIELDGTAGIVKRYPTLPNQEV